jgi:Uma2 family endonuclease
MGSPLAKMTLAEFLAWEELQQGRNEFYRGEVFAVESSSARYNQVVLNLAGRIGDHLGGSSCQVFATSMKVLIDEGALYPDVLVTCGNAEAGDEQFITDPKLIIEVLAPNAGGYDKRCKFALYRTLPSLREYALVDSGTRQAEVFTMLESSDAWLFKDQSATQTLVLESIGLTLPMAEIFTGVEANAETKGHGYPVVRSA